MPKLDCRNIERDPGRCGGQPVVADTRIRVAIILGCYRQGMSVEEIIQQYPALKPSDVHDALAYAYDHMDEIEAGLAADDEAARHARREFLRRSGAALAAVPLTSLVLELAGPEFAGAQESRPLTIVDTHQHLWNLKRFHLPWLDSQPQLKRSYLPADYAKAAEGLGVAKAVYMEVDVEPKQQVEEAEYLIELCEKKGGLTVAAVISGRPAEDGFRPYITRFKDSPYIKGVRQVLHVPSAPRGLCLDERYVAGVRLLGELGKSFDLCMRPAELADGAKLARLCGDTRLIVDHCGNADPKAFMRDPPEKPWHDAEQWKRDMAALAARSNVICKISGIVARAPKDAWRAEHLAPVVNHCLDTFGPDRVVFGSDWPVCTLVTRYRQWVAALKEIIAERDEAAQRKLFSENAARHYGV